MTLTDGDIQLGLQAMESHHWADAYERLRPLLAAESSRPEHLALLEEAAWWVGQTDDSIAAGEQAVAAFTSEGRRADAALVAVSVAEHYAHRQQASLARGWVRRAQNLLDGLPPAPALGHLRRLEAALVSGSEDGTSKAIHLLKEVQEIGAETDDVDLQMLGLHDHGRYMVYQGELDTGMGMMEDALVSAVAGDLSPKVTGRILCNMIEVTSNLADYRSATEWSDEAMRWCEGMDHGGGYPGACRIRRSEFMRLRGDWSAAESEAERAAQELVDVGSYRAQAFNELGMIRLAAGKLEGAAESFHQAHSLGLNPMPGLALLELKSGNPEGSWAMIHPALAGAEDSLPRARLIPAAVEIALAAQRVDEASALADELAATAELYSSDLLKIYSIQAQGRISAHLDQTDDAVGPLTDVVSRLVAWGLPYEAARARCDLGLVLIDQGADQLGLLEINEAKSEFSRLGAAAELDRISEMLDGSGSVEPKAVTKAMMFTDIVDSTKLVGLIGDSDWAELISWHDRTIRGLVAIHDGTEIDHAGDGFFISFDRATDAIEAASEIQRVLKSHRRDAGFSPRVRIGIHVGSALEASEGLVGHEVHAAARVAGAALGDEVLVTEDVVDAVGNADSFGELKLIDAKGISEPVAVRPVIWSV